MRNPIAIEQFERRLIELGCPGRRLRACVQELGDHYQDLQAVALAEGCSESEAATRAAVQLGNPVVLAENLVLGLRQASWWGRHPILGCCLLPLFSLVFIWLAWLSVLVGIGWFWGWLLGPAYRLDQSVISALQSNPVFFNGVAKPLVLSIETVSAIVLTAGFCWLAGRAALGWKWIMATCAACGLACLFFYFWVQPHNLTIGMSWHQPNWPLMFIPLTVAGVVLWRQRTRERACGPSPRSTPVLGRRFHPIKSWFLKPTNLAASPCRPGPLTRRRPPWGVGIVGRLAAIPPLPEGEGRGEGEALKRTDRSGKSSRFWDRLHDGFRTPTYWITTLLVALLLWAVSLRLAETRHSAARRTQLIKFIRPAERAATLAQIKARQQANAGGHETMIDLKPWLNMALDTDTGSLLRMKGNNLASCPGGVHCFAGVPFDVAGRAQLFGRDMTGISKLYPERIRNIAVGARCDRLHLLHGACDVSTPGQPVARLVLHYADGSAAEIPIIAGEHVQDWWGPIYNTDSGAGRYTTDPGTELAWAGSNPAIHKRSPELSLRLYRSAFANPHPELEIKTIDYVSTLTQAAPFLVGLTLETSTP